ncbi:hypothetical protein AXF42_Ash008769 [Apostasia shenzhenica]|uniref:DUF7953 domain-containing protein n=1 Tax=Apostasia shenzhenica TaxID=1088818 RepID=A0A2I0ASG5_9ASPA|nr:hypothetical protein AXF42_Ash008769 [Apostasia shenzhenica]
MKRARCLLPSGLFIAVLLRFLVLLCSLPGIYSVNTVTLGSIEIFDVHEWFPLKPAIYFHCQGEKNKTVLPDVTEAHFLYIFKGEESWQPLTELPDKKCKRCGFYERDTFKFDDVFDEWELCPADFIDGHYVHFKENQFNATFICTHCTETGSDQRYSQDNETKHSKRNVSLIAVICVLASLVAMTGTFAAYKYWQKRKREQDQVRFLKLFEEGDDFEDELGLDPVL